MKAILIFVCLIAALSLASAYTEQQQAMIEGTTLSWKMATAYAALDIPTFNALADQWNVWVRQYFGEDANLLTRKMNVPVEPIKAASENTGGDYLANSATKVYHYPSCTWAQKIEPENRIRFSNSNEAISAGYRPCEKCNPPGFGSSTSITSIDSDWGAVGAGRMGRPAT